MLTGLGLSGARIRYDKTSEDAVWGLPVLVSDESDVEVLDPA